MTAVIEREGDGYVATCSELGIVSQGGTVEEARLNLVEAVEGFFEAASPSEIRRRLKTETYVVPIMPTVPTIPVKQGASQWLNSVPFTGKEKQMTIEILYDPSGKPPKVIMEYNQYEELSKDADLARLFRPRLSELQKFLDDILASGQEAELLIPEGPPPSPPLKEGAVGPENGPKPPLPDIRHYKDARGYYLDEKRFKVLKGSRARGSTSEAFDRISYSKLRDELIRRRILVRDGPSDPFEFAEDYVFDSPSAAACIVAGNSRDGRKEWGPPQRSQ